MQAVGDSIAARPIAYKAGGARATVFPRPLSTGHRLRRRPPVTDAIVERPQ